MKKYIFFFLFSFAALLSCEKDDICVENTTPKLIIRFKDFSNPTNNKTVPSLTVFAENKENLYTNEALDSIAIPLDLSNNFTNFIFQSGTVSDTLNLNYTINDIFVSRSCGYKSNFQNLEITSITANWIKNTTINNATIDNETTAHIIIYH